MSLSREAMNYRRAIQLLGQLEDRIGCNDEFQQFERQVNNCVDTGKNYSFVINSLTKRLDELMELN